jgi:putative cardiolipin synthase
MARAPVHSSRLLLALCATACLVLPVGRAQVPAPRAELDAAIAARPGQSGSLVLERGEQSLLARAWLVDQARRSIDIQYFIWSSDNIGILASEALLRAADRGVRVRVIVDDLLIDAQDRSLLALAAHPNVEIRIYNPVMTVGVPWYRRLYNILTNFRGVNQRMHDKTLIVDAELAITGGRNMADEYYDYDHAYNFRDRDALVMGAVVANISASFARFWRDPLAVPVEQRFDITDVFGASPAMQRAGIDAVYAQLRAYAADPANFAPEVRAAIGALTEDFPALAQQLTWGRVDFISDLPGKNDGSTGLAGGGLSTTSLAALLDSAREEVLIQSPYLVLSDPAIELFRRLRERGVRIRISTNSLASTDNLQAFSGYRSQRALLGDLGIDVREFRPDPMVETQLMQRYLALRDKAPVFALHAKSLVVDQRSVYIGTYNLDPRSENLNTEVGVVLHDASQARRVAAAILTDMRPENSWDGLREDPDTAAGWLKRLKARFWQLLPLRPLL